MPRPRHLLIPLALALGAIVWLAVSERAFDGSPDARAAQSVGDAAPVEVDSVASERRTEGARPQRAQLRVLDRTGAPRAFGPLTVSAPGGVALAELECDSEGWLRFETAVEHGAVWITGPLVFGDFARLESNTGRLDYGTLRLRARGQLEVEVVGIDSGASEVKLALRHRNELGSAPDFGEELVVRVKSGRAGATLRAEALRPVYVTLEGDGLRHAFREREVVVEPGATQFVRLDLTELCSLRARVEGLPPRALAGCAVEVRGVRDVEPTPLPSSEDLPFALGAVARTASARATLDASAKFSVGAMEQLAVRAELQTHGLRVPLVARDAGDSQLATCVAREFVLTPAEPLAAVGIVEHEDQVASPRDFALGFGDEPLGLLQTTTNGWRLVRRADVVARRPLRVFAPGLGLATIDQPSARIDASGLLRVALDEFVQAQAPILVEFAAPPPEGVSLVVRAANSSHARFASDPDLERALNVERSPRGLTVKHAPSGDYELLWTHAGQHRRVERVAHDATRTTRVVLTPPRLVELRGEVVTSEEAANSTERELVRSIAIERGTFAVTSGAFVYRGFDPPSLEVELRLASGARLQAVATLVSDVLRVERPSAALRRLELTPLRAGRLVAEPWPYLENSPAPHIDSAYIQESSTSELLVPASGPSARGRVWEIGEGFKLLRGWYGEAPEHDPKFAGRPVELSLRVPRGPLSIHAIGPHDPLGAPLAPWSGSQPTHLWLPTATSALRIEFANGSARIIEQISDRLVVD